MMMVAVRQLPKHFFGTFEAWAHPQAQEGLGFWFYLQKSRKITKVTSGEELTRFYHMERELAAGFS